MESEQIAINDDYKAIGNERPRRQVDTYPSWLPEQPRYEAIRKAQVEIQKVAPPTP